jgi:hypothetical protein
MVAITYNDVTGTVSAVHESPGIDYVEMFTPLGAQRVARVHTVPAPASKKSAAVFPWPGSKTLRGRQPDHTR